MKTLELRYAAGVACASALTDAPRRPSAFRRLVSALSRAFRRTA